MGWFGNKGNDVVDFSDMQKRGLLPTKAVEKNEDGVVDYSSNSIANSSNSGNTDLDFLSSLAGANAGTGTVSLNRGIEPSPGPITSSLREARKRSLIDSEVNELKLKLDDNEFRLKKITEKIKELESKIDYLVRR